MRLQRPSEIATRPVSFQFVALPAGATEQDYAAAAFDIRPLQDKEVNITFELEIV
jgi:hypothetical protein